MRRVVQALGRGRVWYEARLESAPLTTRMVTTGVILTASDAACQKVQGKQTLDLHRSLTFGVGLGAFWVAPNVHTWFSFLKFYGPRAPLMRTLVDQTVFSPYVNVSPPHPCCTPPARPVAR